MVGFIHKLFRYSIDWLLRNEIESYSTIHGYILVVALKFKTLSIVIWIRWFEWLIVMLLALFKELCFAISLWYVDYFS